MDAKYLLSEWKEMFNRGTMVIGNAIDDFLGLQPKSPVHAGQLLLAEKSFIPDFIVDMTNIWHRRFVHNEMNIYAIVISVLSMRLQVNAQAQSAQYR